jgi:hypothetical protein
MRDTALLSHESRSLLLNLAIHHSNPKGSQKCALSILRQACHLPVDDEALCCIRLSICHF